MFKKYVIKVVGLVVLLVMVLALFLDFAGLISLSKRPGMAPLPTQVARPPEVPQLSTPVVSVPGSPVNLEQNSAPKTPVSSSASEAALDTGTKPVEVRFEGAKGKVPVFLNPQGETARIYVKPGETVSSQLFFPQGIVGEPVRVEMLDGGRLTNGSPGQLLKLDGALSLEVAAKISANDGIHRVRVTRGSQTIQLNYWAGPENIYAEIKKKP